jgi:NADH-quinone oxidoreductase subunit L
MEGPTPVSALIHAATMVTAGVYLIARMHPLFEQSVAAADVGTIIGAVTLFVAATIGMVVTDLKRVIAYSTMSQIGYMIMGVSSGAYVAGMFHLMTHAFFKALLFMSAGSLISAMGSNQNLDDMRGFRKAMPFTFGCFVIGGLALSGVPPFSGFFSKDEILLFQAETGGWHWILYVVGYVTALMTAVYTWRMIFRAFWGEPVEPARELEHGHLHHAPQPTNPATGEVEDTDVGFPGPEHHIAEWALPMKLAMGTLAVLATVGGVVLIPKTTTWMDTFLEPTFKGSSVVVDPSDSLLVIGLVLGAALGVLGIFIAYTIWGRAEGEIAVRVRERVPALHRFLVNKWYFDELIGWVVVKPFAWFGRFAQQTFERLFVNGTLVGGTTGVVRAGSAAVRALQSGFLRAYAALLLVGAGGVILYFLLQSS